MSTIEIESGEYAPIAETFPSASFPLAYEILNSLTHGIGVALSIAALFMLIVQAANSAPESIRAACVFGYSLFGISLIVLYSASTVYHALPPSRLKGYFCVLDHCAIYLLIAGSYSAFSLATLYGPIGWSLFAANWTLAIIGIVQYVVLRDKYKWVSLTLYLFMGWMVVFAIKPLMATIDALPLIMLLAGGLSYTIGCVFFVMHKIWWAHPVWHLFVLGGSVCQFLAAYWMF